MEEGIAEKHRGQHDARGGRRRSERNNEPSSPCRQKERRQPGEECEVGGRHSNHGCTAPGDQVLLEHPAAALTSAAVKLRA